MVCRGYFADFLDVKYLKYCLFFVLLDYSQEFVVLRMTHTCYIPVFNQLERHFSSLLNHEPSISYRILYYYRRMPEVKTNPSFSIQHLKSMALRTEAAVLSLSFVRFKQIILLGVLRWSILYELKPAKRRPKPVSTFLIKQKNVVERLMLVG